MAKEDAGRPDKDDSEGLITSPWFKILKISIAGYLPAFLIVLMSAFLFKSTITLPQEGKVNRLSQVPTTEERKQIIKEIAKDVKRQLESQQEEAKNDASQQNEVVASLIKSPNTATSIWAKGYIDAKINEKFTEQNQNLAEQAAEDKIEKLQALWKEDLLDKIIFPVVFTIVSIFAAFAVKDVLMEILKEQERGKIKTELQEDLKNYLKEYLVSHIIEEKQKPLTSALKAVEASTYWLEHELLNIEINQIINDSSLLDSNEIKEKSQLAVQKLFDRANLALDNISHDFKNDDFLYFKKAENKILSTKLTGLGLGQVNESIKPQKAGTKIDQIMLLQESKYKRIDELFEVQMRFMISTLTKLQKKLEDPSEINGFINDLQRHLARDINLEAYTRESEFISDILPPLSIQEIKSDEDLKD